MNARKRAKVDVSGEVMLTRRYFYESERSLPLAGIPGPLPCPFCGETDAEVVFELQENGEDSARVQCGGCLAESPGVFSLPVDHKSSFQLALEAARQWNGGPPELVIARGKLAGAK